MSTRRAAWAPHLIEGLLRLLTAVPLIGYEAHLHAHGVPTTWITLLIVGILAGPAVGVVKGVLAGRVMPEPAPERRRTHARR